MARRVVDFTISDDGRDKGKVFHITEMPAAKAEEWAMRALFVLTKAGVELPDGTSGMAGIAATSMGALGAIPFFEAKELLNEMLECVQFIPNPKKNMVMRPLTDDDTEEVMTRLRLRAEVFTLHTGFSIAELLSKQSSATKTSPLTSSEQETSRPISES